jgi:hypothetical protein
VSKVWMEVCPGRHCPGPCPADDCYVHRITVGLPLMEWDEAGPEPETSEHVESELERLFRELDG